MADTNRLEPASNPPRTSEKTIVIVPTYNERENLPALLKDISAHLPGAGILVVDDSSPDGTGELAEGMKNEYPNLSVLHRAEKTGLADAYREAFRHALALGADYVITMDADLSHDPRYLPDIVRGFTKADVVVGSRYTRGISIVNWPLSRLMLSHFGNWYARTVTSLKIRDCTSGFVGYRRKVLEILPLDRIYSHGYSYSVEMKYLSRLAGFRIIETPIIFYERTEGASKMSAGIALEAIWKVLALRFTAGSRLKKGLRSHIGD